jgi:hypothetical protein
MMREQVVERADRLVKLAVAKRRMTPLPPVSDEAWNELLDLGARAKRLTAVPRLLELSIPKSSEERTWPIVEHSANSASFSTSSGGIYGIIRPARRTRQILPPRAPRVALVGSGKGATLRRFDLSVALRFL